MVVYKIHSIVGLGVRCLAQIQIDTSARRGRREVPGPSIPYCCSNRLIRKGGGSGTICPVLLQPVGRVGDRTTNHLGDDSWLYPSTLPPELRSPLATAAVFIG